MTRAPWFIRFVGTLTLVAVPSVANASYIPHPYPHPYRNGGGGGGDTLPPVVGMIDPPAGATVSGTTTVSANAIDNVGVVGVRFRLDGANLGNEDLTGPYSISWNTTTAADGVHTLSAVARDAAGNLGQSAGRTVTVSNGGPALPIASYRLDEGSGTVVLDSSGNGWNGAIFGGALWSTGVYAGALRFDGVNDYVSIGVRTLPPAFTISAWINNSTNGQYETIVSFGVNRQFALTYGSLSFWPGYGAERRFGLVPTRSWRHVAFTYDGSVMRAYLNGVPLGSPFTISLPAYSGPTLFGAWPTSSGGRDDFLSARLDDIRIYPRALTQSQIQSDMSVPVH